MIKSTYQPTRENISENLEIRLWKKWSWIYIIHQLRLAHEQAIYIFYTIKSHLPPHIFTFLLDTFLGTLFHNIVPSGDYLSLKTVEKMSTAKKTVKMIMVMITPSPLPPPEMVLFATQKPDPWKKIMRQVSLIPLKKKKVQEHFPFFIPFSRRYAIGFWESTFPTFCRRSHCGAFFPLRNSLFAYYFLLAEKGITVRLLYFSSQQYRKLYSTQCHITWYFENEIL